MVGLHRVEEPGERQEIRRTIQRHRDYTGSAVARRILDTWDFAIRQFVKVLPTEYERVLRERAEAEALAEQGVA